MTPWEWAVVAGLAAITMALSGVVWSALLTRLRALEVDVATTERELRDKQQQLANAIQSVQLVVARHDESTQGTREDIRELRADMRELKVSIIELANSVNKLVGRLGTPSGGMPAVPRG